MDFYKIKDSVNTKIVGTFPQANDSKSILTESEINIIEKGYLNRISDNNVKFPTIILQKKSKITDLISVSYLWYSGRLLISLKLKSILNKFKQDNFQFFPTTIINKSVEEDNYWVVNPCGINYKIIDYPKCIISRKNLFDYTQKEAIKINSAEEFEGLITAKDKEIFWSYSFEKLVLKPNTPDFFFLTGINGLGYCVSKIVKEEIEIAGCTGIEFELINQD